jgi:general secretion pathway protein J
MPCTYPTNPRPHKASGFTLIEVMLAISITAFIAGMAYQGLSAATTAARSHEQQVRLLSDIQLPLTVIERDVRHVVRRSIRDEFDSTRGGLMGGNFSDYPLELTRRGWDNPRNLPRGELQRVRYVLENDELWRESWSVLDRMTEEDGQRRTLLLKGVTELKIAFLNPNGTNAQQSELGGEWIEEWEDPLQVPFALDITIDVERFGQVRRVFSIVSDSDE